MVFQIMLFQQRNAFLKCFRNPQFCFVFFRPVIKVECVHTYTIYTINSSAVSPLLPAFDGFSRPTGSVFCDYVDAMRIVFFSALLYINLPVVLDGTSRMFKESIV